SWAQTHSALRPAARTTLAHFSVSSAISLPNSAAEPGSGSPPKAANLAFIPGSVRNFIICPPACRARPLASLEHRLALFLHRQACLIGVFAFLDFVQRALGAAGLFGRSLRQDA